MKTRPILFKGEMVRALLDGRKTQTRRIVKPQPIPFQPNYPHPEAECLAAIGKPWMPVGGVNVERWKCPHGTIGDRLWVRETFQTGEYAQNEPRGAVYRATDPDWQTQVETVSIHASQPEPYHAGNYGRALRAFAEHQRGRCESGGV